MKYRRLGATDLQVSEIGFGAWAIGGNAHGNSYGPTEDAESLRALALAVDHGCTFFDTADVYGQGHSEELLGQALKDVRDKVVIATKGGSDFYHQPARLNFTESHMIFAVEQSLRRLHTDRIDLYQLHNPPFSLLESGRLFEPLERLKQQGKIRYYGISIHDPQEGLLAIKVGKPSTIQVVYNYLRRDAAEELFPRALAEGVGILAREPLANGFLTGKYTKDSIFPMGDIRHQWPSKYQAQLINRVNDFLKTVGDTSPFTPAQTALRFVLAQPAVSTVLAGSKTVAQTEENLKTSGLAVPIPVR
jgi:aryl-alcohol dehydrogenase-like predicted oxidoreductase